VFVCACVQPKGNSAASALDHLCVGERERKRVCVRECLWQQGNSAAAAVDHPHVREGARWRVCVCVFAAEGQ